MKIKTFLRTILFMAIGVIMALVMTACGAKTEIDLSEIVTVSVTGADTKGITTFGVDTKPLDALAKDKDEQTLLKYMQFLASISSTADKSENIKNGDEIVVTSTYSQALADELGFNVINTEKTITASGLESLKEIKISNMLKLAIDEKGNASLYCDYAEVPYEILAYISLKRDNGDTIYWEYKLTDVKNGDKIKVIASVPDKVCEDELTRNGYVLTETEYEFTVEGLSELVTNTNQLSEEHIKTLDNSVYQYAKKLTDSYVVPKYDLFNYYYSNPGAYDAMQVFTDSTQQVNGCILSIDKLNLTSKYLYTAKDVITTDPECSMFYFYDLELTFAISKDKTITTSGIIVFWLGKPKISPNNEVNYSEINYYSCFKDKDEAYKTILERNQDNYNCTEIK